MSSPTVSLGQALNSRDNALNAVRLILASLVILSHVGPILALENFPWWAAPLGGWAVSGFFVISGYLIAGSREHLTFGRFLVRRSARIYPAFWVQLIAVAAIAAPLAKLAGAGSFSISEALSFVWKNATLYITQWEIGTTPPNYPAWNGSLWTLFYEFGAYLVVGTIFGIPWVRRHGAPMAALLALCAYSVYPLSGPLDITTNLYLNAAKLAVFFLVGVLAYYLRDVIPARWDLIAVAGALVIVIYIYGDMNYFAHLPLGYLVLATGAIWKVRWGAVNDISYGVYIYAFPIQHLLGIYLGVDTWGYALAAAACLVATIPVAWASWIFVERPVINWARRMTPRRKRPIEAA